MLRIVWTNDELVLTVSSSSWWLQKPDENVENSNEISEKVWFVDEIYLDHFGEPA